jgi:hypothetical protein
MEVTKFFNRSEGKTNFNAFRDENVNEVCILL